MYNKHIDVTTLKDIIDLERERMEKMSDTEYAQYYHDVLRIISINKGKEVRMPLNYFTPDDSKKFILPYVIAIRTGVL